LTSQVLPTGLIGRTQTRCGVRYLLFPMPIGRIFQGNFALPEEERPEGQAIHDEQVCAGAASRIGSVK